jgi:RNA methyltransferase, TrmH family
VKSITSRDNPRFKALHALAEDSRRQRKEGRTILDGPHLVAAHRQAGGRPELLVVSESGLSRPEAEPILASHEGVETLVLRDTLFKDLSGVASPVGVLAVIAIPAKPQGPIRGSCVLLDAIQDAGNVGTILRTAAAAGVLDVALGPGCAAAWSPRVLRAGQGAHFHLRIRDAVDLAPIIGSYGGRVVATVAGGGQSIYDLDLRGPVAWLFGNEGAGVSAGLLERVGLLARIPMAPGCESMNVAAAAAVCLFESVRQSFARGERQQ